MLSPGIGLLVGDWRLIRVDGSPWLSLEGLRRCLIESVGPVLLLLVWLLPLLRNIALGLVTVELIRLVA